MFKDGFLQCIGAWGAGAGGGGGGGDDFNFLQS